MDKIEKFLPDNQDLFLEIEIEKESLHHRKGEVYAAEAIIELPGKKLVAKAKEEDLQKAITEVEKELEIEIKKYKLKKIELPRRQAKKSHQEEGF